MEKESWRGNADVEAECQLLCPHWDGSEATVPELLMPEFPYLWAQMC